MIKQTIKQKIYYRALNAHNASWQKQAFKNFAIKLFSLSLLIILNTNLYSQDICPTCTSSSTANSGASSSGTCSNSGTCTACTSPNPCCLGICDGYPYLQMRSQGREIARQFAGLEDFLYKSDRKLTYGTFSLTTEYTQSFNSKKLSHFLFGSDLVNCCELYVQGSAIQDRNQKAWLADYFGLPKDFSSRVKFNPEIKNVVIDLNFYIGLDELTPGLFLNIDAPFTWTKWDLNQCEQLISTGTTGYQAGYMAQTAINSASLNKSFLQIMQGGYTFADMQIPMRYGKINNCDNSKSRFAEIDFTLGYNFILNNDAHFGAFLYGSAPTGTRPCAEKLFEPIIGNGKHWELGGGLTASYIFYRSQENENRYIGFWFDAIVDHLFKTRQVRSFDICGRPNSRYMLLEEIAPADGNLTGATPSYTPTENQYVEVLVPLINWSTFNIKTQINFQTDICIKLAAARDNINFDLGYNFWARTGEKFSNFTSCPCDTSANYAIKGDSILYGQYTDNIFTPTIIPLSQSQNNASIHGPSAIDNPELAFYTEAIFHEQVTQISGSEQIETSISPIATSRSSLLNLNNSPAAITHKFFGNFEYAWKDIENKKDREKNIPFIGFGAKVEFSQDKYKDCCNCKCDNSSNIITSCSSNNSQRICLKENTAPRVALSQWGVWVKGGVSFN